MSTPGCHYSFEEIKILCDYAELRGVELIPEIELPGHSQAMVKAYPEIFRNTPDGEVAVDDYSLFNNTDEDNIICIGKEGVMDALREILTELAEMFPKSKYIHIGGDEATITDWAHCRDCKRYMQEHGINGVKALYSHCVKEITDIVLDIGRTPIVWEGFPEKGSEKIPPETIVISWENHYQTTHQLLAEGFRLVSGGTDNHLMLIDLRGRETTGKDLENRLGSIGITVNKNAVPNDPRKPSLTSGIRVGTPAATTRGLVEEDFVVVADIITAAIGDDFEEKKEELRTKVAAICVKYPLYN